MLVRRLGAVALAFILLPAVAAHAAREAPPVPSSMAALGDSITRGRNACGPFIACVARSWSTGWSAGVHSHFRMIESENPAIDGHNHNDAADKARAADLPGQATTAVGQGVDYVTVLIGANDACTRTEAGMTSVADYRAAIDQALAVLRTGLPEARIAVVSVPDLFRLWQVGHVDPDAVRLWNRNLTCQSMLANATSADRADVDRRSRVRDRVIGYNEQLAAACAAYGPLCDFDDDAVFGYPFTLDQLSMLDRFHPNGAGQDALGLVSYASGFDW
ncbi:lysophospholipase L1-like esterase [Hamadaea flava]|uniref:GDSL-type esterase/lipase family protein n=1 Tax=Hamadaea flava TaxID=1742688 RepID=A0ABV8LVX9_9ACTN|nr:GDSL-type esterase/lipase family protein [Hamadaea flava]MCP2328197.1 lysophospholipase L1-like esterase [Hamadaea flava]